MPDLWAVVVFIGNEIGSLLMFVIIGILNGVVFVGSCIASWPVFGIIGILILILIIKWFLVVRLTY